MSGKADGHRQGALETDVGVVIPYREWWQPNARAAIVYLHGQGDHGGPFTAMGDVLHELGLNVYAHDHRGFGLSRQPRGDIGSYDEFVSDALTMIDHAQQANVGRPVFLLGLSMGGHIALRTAYRAGRRIAGVIALSPGLKLRNAPPWSLVLKTALYAVFSPTRPMASVTANIVTTRNQTHLERASQDEHWVKAYTARFYMAAVRSLRKARREVRDIPVPVLIMQAAEDYLISPDESRRFFDLIGHPDKEFCLLEGMCHNLVVEPEMPEIAAKIAQWVDRRL